MRRLVGLNAQLLATPGTYRAAGISRYISGMVGRLPKVAARYDYMAWVPQVTANWSGVQQRVSGIGDASVIRRLAWEQTSLPNQVATEGAALFHGLAFAVPLAMSMPTVVTIPDLSYRVFPQFHPRWRRLYLRLISTLSVRRARAVIAISHAGKRDICDLMGVLERKVYVTPLAAGDDYRPLSEAERLAFRESQGLGPYIYYQGTLEPRKQLLTLVEAYRRLRLAGHVQHRLVLGGAPGWDYERIYRAIEEGDLTDHVTLLGYVAADAAPSWYAAADVFVYPSAYEGFGLPPLEAMACGTPVVVADASAMPEVVGPAGALVPPGDAAMLSEALRHVLTDPMRSEEMRTVGLARAGLFTWEETARLTAAVYDQCLG